MEKEKLGFIGGIKAEFSTRALVLIPICAGINLVGGAIASGLKLPVFLDMIGTVVSAALAGPWVATIVGVLTNVFLALVSNPVYLPYALVSVSVALVTGYMIRAGLFKSVWGVVLTCIAATAVSVVTASSVTVFVFGGATGATGASIMTASLIATLGSIWKGVVTSAIIENLLDRAIAFAIAYVILKKIPRSFISQYQQAALDR
ncbi:MAG TPA: ECF transporter S component [Firmicutes bacterium]|uniref:ECF transporter S component n=1 Tax=Capillibacterium thermochitinicola TaxID=2699427 RepID=A0A8J6HZ94_9FIRM|nr:ECF transporter S component [Capillibacterium thermochitinicola]MBA2132098.1 ECF transporter S component [Capillibacterium thermochitinicola]HHW12845.1 ECF transporter S component [Bacillota bacterium]